MVDDKNNRGPQDRARISMTEDYEVQYWTKELGVIKEVLQRAVSQVGNVASTVREYLKR